MEKHAHQQPQQALSVDLWCVHLDESITPALLAQYCRLLSPQELEQAERFRSQADRLRAIVGRVLMRWALSQYRQIEPADWQFAATVLGKPYIQSPEGLGLQLNLSHSRDVTVCAITIDHDVGVDVEAMDRHAQYTRIAERFFAPQEAQMVHSLPADKQAETFIRLWTLKEALLKACGRGLSLPLDCARFSLSDDRATLVSLHDPSLGDPAEWQLAEVRLEGAGSPSGATAYQIAVAVRSRRPLQLSIRQTLPQRWIANAHTLPSPSAMCRIDVAQLQQRA